MHRPHASAPQILAENRRRYELLAEISLHHASQGDAERMLRAAMIAANYGWLAPTGLLGDIRLERAVVHVVRGSGTVQVDGQRHAGRVLHVLSESFHTGGHTRLVWRWMRRDQRVSDVVLTNQSTPAPPQLIEAARASGGQVHDLRAVEPDFLDRAHALRRHMDRADLVVLHVHPYDSIALAAVNLPGLRPPVIYENHTDQSFWLGLGAADLLCDLRPEAQDLDVAMRGVDPKRIAVLPMPIQQPQPAGDEELRRRLGIAPDAVVALTVSDDWKLAPSWGRGMHHLVERVLQWSPQLTAVLVGASPSADWARLAKRFPGRVHPVGRVLDSAPYFAIADIYLDSYPIRSTTSALEAAVLGLPIVTLDDLPTGEPASLLQANSPGLAGNGILPTVEKAAVTVRKLASDDEQRRRLGAQLRAAVTAAHDGPGWQDHMELLYRQARSMPPADLDGVAACPADERYGQMLVSAMTSGGSLDPHLVLGPLGPQFDRAMEADLFAAFQRSLGASLSLRVAAGWEGHPDWMVRLITLAGDRPMLRVSIPFLPGDNVSGSRTTAILVELLTRAGSTPETCGNLNVENSRPAANPSISDELPFSDEAFDWLESLVSSPCWVPLATAAREAALLDVPA